jgi:hypothetical protein
VCSIRPVAISLTLDPSLPLPPYHAAVDIHCQPGGYHTELRKEDVTAGAIYDRAVYCWIASGSWSKVLSGSFFQQAQGRIQLRSRRLIRRARGAERHRECEIESSPRPVLRGEDTDTATLADQVDMVE